jgi:hypothetical protein
MTTITDPQNPPATVEERYTGATSTSNLKVEARRQLPADLLIAAGWSPTRLGAALLRLHSEWDGAEKPPRPTRERVDQIAAKLPPVKEGGRDVLDVKGARRVANEWYVHELKILFQKLKTMPEVRHQLQLWAQHRDIEEGERLAAGVLAWWLDHTCPACSGRGQELIKGAPVKSTRNCSVCKGTAETPKPGGMMGRLMLDHINDCVTRARASLKQRLQHGRPKKSDSSA